MIQVNELLMITIGVVLTILLVVNKHKYKKIPHSHILFSSYIVIIIAWTATVLEGVFFNSFFNFIEHSCYAVSSFLLLFWIIKLTTKKRV